jgi:pimeloyl-ACP methyl ester carboxylesterase
MSLLILSCSNGGTDLADILNDQRPVEWWSVPWRGGPLDVALVHPDEAVGSGPHPVIFALTWGSGSVNEVMDMVFTYWLDEPPIRGYYVVAPQVVGSSLATNAVDLIPAIFEWMDGKIDYDPNKVALVGASNGGRGVFFSAVEHPDRFGALVGMPGRYEGDGTDLDGFAGKPVLLLVGELDEGWLEESQSTLEFLEASGADATLAVIEGQGHVLSLNMVTVMNWIDEALGF